VVVITTATVAKGTLVAVTDNRSTIPDDFKDRMFDAAYQNVDDRVRVLRACRQSMSRHGGKVGVLSEAGLGTTVTMRFPRPKAIE